MRENENKSSGKQMIRAVLIGLIALFLVSSLVLFISAILVSKEIIGEDMMSDCAIVASLLGGFVGSLVSVRLRGSAALLTGATTGVTFVVLKLIISLISENSEFDGGTFLVTSVFLIAGAVLGAMPKKRQHKKRHKT